MIAKKADAGTGVVKVTFSLPVGEPGEPVYVAGDFNGWDGSNLQLRTRSNGRRSAAVVLPAGSRVAFRYVTASGHWFDDERADGFEPNELGGHNGLVLT